MPYLHTNSDAPLGTTAVARILGYSEAWIRKLDDAGHLPALLKTADGRRIYDPKIVEAFAEQRRH